MYDKDVLVCCPASLDTAGSFGPALMAPVGREP
jgi:hypothetical protein